MKDLKAAKRYFSHPPGAEPEGVDPESGPSRQPWAPSGLGGRSRPRTQPATSTSRRGALRAHGASCLSNGILWARAWVGRADRASPKRAATVPTSAKRHIAV